MPVQITATVGGLREAIDHIEKVINYTKNSGEELALAGFNAAGTVFEQNFDSGGKGYGLGGWAKLAASTVRERESKGFGGERPILIRYGDLRYISATALRVAGGSGTFAATDPDGKTVRMTLNVGRDGGHAIMWGDKAWNQLETGGAGGRHAPARPYWLTTPTVTRAIRKRVVQTLAEGIRRL